MIFGFKDYKKHKIFHFGSSTSDAGHEFQYKYSTESMEGEQ